MARGRAFPAAQLTASAFAPWKALDFFHHEILHVSKKQGSRARVGRLHTPHGTVETPGFVVVGTNGAVKFVDHRQASDAGMELMFANTLHLILHPGVETMEKAGGLHKLMGREHKPLITDSGGFQIFSFANRGQDAMPGDGGAKYVNASASADEDQRCTDHAPGGESLPCSEDLVSEIKSSRHVQAQRKYGKSAAPSAQVKLTEEGARFHSYRDGSIVHLTPESTVAAQKAIGVNSSSETTRFQPSPTSRPL